VDDLVKPLTKQQALEAIRRVGEVESISALAEMLGWERTKTSRTVPRWEQEGEIVRKRGPGGKVAIIAVVAAHTPAEQPVVIIPAPVQHAPAQVAHPVAHPARGALSSILATITPTSISAATAFFVAAGLGACGLIINMWFAISYARSGTEGAIAASLGALVDLLAFWLPSGGCQLWRRGARTAALVAWCVWPFVIAVSLMACVGFSAANFSDALAKRSAAATSTTNTASDIQRWRAERDGITEKRSVEELEIQLQRERPKVDRVDRDAWADTKGCTANVTMDRIRACSPTLQTLQALAQAKRRAKLSDDINLAENKQSGAPTMTSVDPQAETAAKLLAWISRGWIAPSPDDIALVRLVGWTVAPSLAGLVLAFAHLLSASRSGHRDEAA
jgi:hypothetical protein